METIPFIGRDLGDGESLVRLITYRPFPDATAIAVISQSDGTHLVAVRSIRGRRQRNVAFTDLDDAMLDEVVNDLVDQAVDSGHDITITDGAEAATSALEALAFAMIRSPAAGKVRTTSGRGVLPRPHAGS